MRWSLAKLTDMPAISCSLSERKPNVRKHSSCYDDLSIESYAIALPRGDWALRLAVNTGLASVFRSGLIFAGFERWFGRFGLQPGALSQAAWALGALSD